MSQVKIGQNSEVLSLDYAYILRRIYRNIFIIIMCVCVVGAGSYMILDCHMEDSYTANVNLAVISRDDSSARMAEYNVARAVSRSLNVLNSDILKEQISKKEKNGVIDGTVSAQQVGASNLITLAATGSSAEQAFRLLKMALNTYPELTEYFQSGYRMKVLNNLSADNIVKNAAEPGKYAMMIAILVALAGMGLVAVYCVFTDKIHNEEQARMLLDIDILGSIHFMKKKENQRAILITMQETAFSYFDEIDKLTTRVLGKESQNCRTLMVTSIQENEGKSTIAANIALSLARRGKRVLLLDADMRRPALAKIFDKEASECREFLDFLEGRATLEQILDSADSSKNLLMICQKKAIADPDKILNEESLGKALGEFRKLVDYIIIDTSPVGVVRDAEVIAKWADDTLLSIRQDEESAAAVNDVVDMLEDAGTTVIGAVLNMARGRMVSPKGKYGKYYNTYGSKNNELR